MMSFKYNLNLMRESETTLSYVIDDAFFSQKDYSLIQKAQVDAKVVIKRRADHYEATIHLTGEANATCTRCLDDVVCPIDSQNVVKIKLSDQPKEDDDYVYVWSEDGMLDLEPLLYDYLILSLPAQPMHQEGECNAEMAEQLKKYIVTETEE